MRRSIQFPSAAAIEAALALALAAGLLWVAFSGIGALRLDWASLRSWRSAQSRVADYKAVHQRVISSLGGITADGRVMLLNLSPKGATRYVAFVAHSASLGGDVSLWASVAHILPAKAQYEIVGYCDHITCIREFHTGVRYPAFPVFGFAEYVTDRLVANADADHRALVFDSTLVNLGSVPWTSDSSPEAVAAAIEKIQ